MASRERPRQSGDEERRELTPAPEPRTPAASILELQRSAGHRALQRLIYGQGTKQLTVAQAYGDQRVRWDGKQTVKTGGKVQPIKDLYTDSTFKEHLHAGLNLGNDELAKITPRT